jgi:DNA-binding helix-hairpin-helix protein with protein kinase domain
MDWLLKRGQVVVARGMQSAYIVQDMLGEGGQAEVYRASIDDRHYALKWYRKEYVQADRRLWERLKTAINAGSPTDRFLWPFDLVSLPHHPEYGGYLMPIRPPEFISVVEITRGRVDTSFRSLMTLGFEMADSFMKLHALGMCYRDINYGNFFFHPKTGEIRIADTDNVDVNMKPGGILGTPGFMAPEVCRGQMLPNSMTDRFSMAVLLYCLFMLGHPLKGRRELELPFQENDRDGSLRLCCTAPVFVYDPDDDSNRPVKGIHDVMMSYWPIYPKSLQALFTGSFTKGLHDPEARVMDKEWCREMSVLRDSIFECRNCEAENFFNLDRVKKKQPLEACWSCGRAPELPSRMRITGAHGARLVVLSRGTQLFPHHLNGDEYNFSTVLAEVAVNPLGLKNLSGKKWTATTADGTTTERRHGEVLPLSEGCRIHFGGSDAEIKL